MIVGVEAGSRLYLCRILPSLSFMASVLVEIGSLCLVHRRLPSLIVSKYTAYSILPALFFVSLLFLNAVVSNYKERLFHCGSAFKVASLTPEILLYLLSRLSSSADGLKIFETMPLYWKADASSLVRGSRSLSWSTRRRRIETKGC